MTTQTQQFIELSDVIALRCECKNCHTVVLVPVPGTLDGALSKCPKCKQAWAKLDTGDSHELEIDRFLGSLRLLSQIKMGCSIRLEVTPATVSREKSQ